MKSKLYPYLISIIVAVYISMQFLSIASTSNIGVTLQEVALKQKGIFDFLISQSIESAIRTSISVKTLNQNEINKDNILKLLSYNQDIEVYDINFFDLEGNLLSESFEGFTSFKSLFGDLRLDSVIEPTVVDIRYSELYKDTVMDILVPVYHDNKLETILWQTESFERINAAIKNVSILESGESYIIDEHGQVLTDLKYADISKSSVSIKDESILLSTFDGFEKKPYQDYHDTSVYGYHMNLNFNKWKLIVEINTNEVLNTTANLNSFILKTVTLVLAATKLLEPVIKTMTDKKNQTESTTKEFQAFVECGNYLLHHPVEALKCYLRTLKNIYLNHRHRFNIMGLVTLIFISVLSIGSVKMDHDIQTNLNLSNQVNRRLVSYYVSELKGRFYALNRTITESSSYDLQVAINNALKTNSNLLNIVVVDDQFDLIYQAGKKGIHTVNAKAAISNQSTLYHSVGISDIFYDTNYNQYVFYFSSKVYDHKTQDWYDTIGVISVNNLTSMINHNELHPSRMISILNGDKIMYSNHYKSEKIPSEQYNYLKRNLDTITLSDNLFNVNKYKNMDDTEVYGSYTSVNDKDVLVYGSYGTISNTQWQLLYEEPVATARARVYKTSLNLLVEMIYQYIQDTINNLK